MTAILKYINLLLVSGLLVLFASTNGYTCNCYCGCVASLVGTAVSATCSQSACSSACLSAYGSNNSCRSPCDTGYCANMTNNYQCPCVCGQYNGAIPLGNSFALTNAGCTASICRSSCSIVLPITCGHYTNNAFCGVNTASAGYSCVCQCATSSSSSSTSNVGSAFSSTCTDQSCQSACSAAYPSCASYTNQGYCPYNPSLSNRCACSCQSSTNTSSPFGIWGWVYATTCTSSACQLACGSLYSASCGTYVNNAYCDNTIGTTSTSSSTVSNNSPPRYENTLVMTTVYTLASSLFALQTTNKS